MKHSRSGANTAGAILGVVLLITAGLLFWQRTFISDYVRAAAFDPSSEVVQLAENTSMNSRAERYFYAHRPVLEPTQRFNEYCANVEKTANVLGCYDGQRIYLFDVDNPVLSGVEEVTAAHEMLHVAYDRLSVNERNQVDKMLNTEAEKLSDDSVFSKRMSAYQSLSNHELMHELHSILGTEIDDLSDDLEGYYGRYFDDRGVVVGLYQQYSNVFGRLTDQAEVLARQLDQLAISINNASQAYTSNIESLSQSIEDFNRRAETGGFISQQEFDSARSPLVTAQQSSRQDYGRIRQMIDQYNNLKREYDQTASHLSELNNSIDSTLAPVPNV